jgi:hypothetical protein
MGLLVEVRGICERKTWLELGEWRLGAQKSDYTRED